jgi:excisionase family DNA binding protein
MQLLSVDEARQMLGLGRTAFYELLRAGALPAKKLGKRTLVSVQDIERFIAGMPPYKRISAPVPENNTEN